MAGSAGTGGSRLICSTVRPAISLRRRPPEPKPICRSARSRKPVDVLGEHVATSFSRISAVIARELFGAGERSTARVAAFSAARTCGSPKRRNGLLNNELYNGSIVYNRQRFLKDPATGKRVSRPNPEDEWLRQEAPELRIVEETLWQRVQRVREARGGPHIHTKRGPKRLLSGLVYCGCCGARYNVSSRDWLRCSARTNSGMCLESRPIRMGEVEHRVLASIEKHVLTPDIVSAATQAYREEFERAQGDRDSMRDRLDAELMDVDRKLSRLLRLVEEGHTDPGVAGPRLNELAAQKRQLAAEIAVRPNEPERIFAGDGGESYRALVRNLRSELGEGRPGTGEAAALVRGLVRRIEIRHSDDGERQPIEVEAGFSGIMQSSDHDCNVGCGGQI